MVGNKRICDYVIEAIHLHLYRISPANARFIFLAYLRYYPQFRAFSGRQARSRARNQPHRQSQAGLVQEFIRKYEKEVASLSKDELSLETLDRSKLEPADWETGFSFVPVDMQDPFLMAYSLMAVPEIVKELMVPRRSGTRPDNWDYHMEHRFFTLYSHFLLYRTEADIPKFFAPVLANFNVSSEIADLLGELIGAQIRVDNYDGVQ